MADRTGTKAADAEAKSATERLGDAARGAADTLRQGAERARDSFTEHVMDPARRAGEAMRSSGEKIAATGSTISTRMIDQAETNAQEAFAAMRAAAGAKDISEVMKIQGDYLREQSQRSMTQAREVGEMIAQFGRDALGTLRGGMNQPPKP